MSNFMMGSNFALATFHAVDSCVKQNLGEVLWNLCGQCDSHLSCIQRTCPWSRAKRFNAFWAHYMRLTQAYNQERLGRRPALGDHDDLLAIIGKIYNHRNLARTALERSIFEDELSILAPELFS